ncbi:hypothetical protein KUTeg_013659 [Tegillarca granosa]|uniref:Neutral metalloproteinase n=1 Tax=Tegillarca granosa TaxID=220873 RepID=A0ABQ9EY74_TEGGR|nr:hypothetical protein KUTeg_013659 [Tegillarca granosa]
MDFKRVIFISLLILKLTSECESAKRINAKQGAKETMRKRDVFSKRDIDEEVSVNELLSLNHDETMEVKRSIKTSQGIRVEKLQEKYKGVEVFDSSVSVEVDKNGKLTGDASGTIIQEIQEDLKSLEPQIPFQVAFENAVTAEGDNDIIDTINIPSPSLKVYLDSSDTARLVYHFQYFVIKNDEPKKPAFFVDAMNGEVLLHWNNLDTKRCGTKANAVGGTEYSGKITYGEVPFCLDMKTKDGTCFLENKYVRVIDMLNTKNESIDETVSFDCNEGYNDTVNGAFSPAMDAFFYGTILGKMFEDWFQSTPVPGKLIFRVHYGKNYSNAFWNGDNCTFGDGDQDLYPLVSLDIVCHEVGHGVTEHAADLMYFGQAGGLNEAFSDMLGEACESYFDTNDFLMGDGIIKNFNRTYIRSMRYPDIDGNSIKNVDDYNPDLDPHFSSGIYNRVFYVVVKQKGVEIRKVIKVFHYANLMYWHHMSSFEDASCGVLKAAYDLGQKPTPYMRALKDVGIETCDLSQHIRSLVNNKTYEDITVSVDSEPFFAFESPEWADNLVINTTSSNGDVGITYVIGSWNQTNFDFDNDKRTPVSSKSVEIPDVGNTVVFLSLTSLNGLLMDDVTIRAGYRCSDTYNVTEKYKMVLYEYYCINRFQ